MADIGELCLFGGAEEGRRRKLHCLKDSRYLKQEEQIQCPQEGQPGRQTIGKWGLLGIRELMDFPNGPP